jgi:hypothetical protein
MLVRNVQSKSDYWKMIRIFEVFDKTASMMTIRGHVFLPLARQQYSIHSTHATTMHTTSMQICLDIKKKQNCFLMLCQRNKNHTTE